MMGIRCSSRAPWRRGHGLTALPWRRHAAAGSCGCVEFGLYAPAAHGCESGTTGLTSVDAVGRRSLRSRRVCRYPHRGSWRNDQRQRARLGLVSSLVLAVEPAHRAGLVGGRCPMLSGRTGTPVRRHGGAGTRMPWGMGMLGTVEQDSAVERDQKQAAQEKGEKAMTPSPCRVGAAGIGWERHSASAERPTPARGGGRTTGYMAKGLGRRRWRLGSGPRCGRNVSRTGMCHGPVDRSRPTLQGRRPAENRGNQIRRTADSVASLSHGGSDASPLRTGASRGWVERAVPPGCGESQGACTPGPCCG